jgi:8-oxo-dGTP pyrophosphatase MutT (NUDIX family)
MKIKIIIKRSYYKIIRPFRKAYWFLVRPETHGAKILIEHNGNFLFIRNSYGKKLWTFPGGGKDKNESPQEAAHRETLEEVGIVLSESTYLGEYTSRRQHKRDTVYCFHGVVSNSNYHIDPQEIEEAKWFPLSNIPEPTSFAVSEVLELYKEKVINRT